MKIENTQFTAGGITVNPNGQADALYGKKPAWHGIGHVTEECASLDEVLATGTLAWEVSKQQILHPISGKPLNHYGIFRTDRDDEGSLLGMCSDRYTPLQNKELLELGEVVLNEAGTGRFASAGSLHGGQEVFAALDINASVEVAGDLTNMYLVVISSFNGKYPLSLGVLSDRPECQNMVAHAMAKIQDLEAEGGLGMTTRHSKLLEERITKIKQLFSSDLKLVDRLRGSFKTLSGTKVDPSSERWEKLLTKVFQLDTKIKDDGTGLKARAERLVGEITDIYVRNINEVPDALRYTAYDAYQAITFYANHEAQTRVTAQAQAQGYDEKQLRKLGMMLPNGTGGKHANNAWNILLEMCK